MSPTAENPRRPSGADLAQLRRAILACERGVRYSEPPSPVPPPSGPPASAVIRPDEDRIPTGFEALDELLGGGLHAGALNEVFTAASGSGALEALLPAILRADAGKRMVAWIHPTRAPYPPALVQAGADLARWLIVRPHHDEDLLWSIDQVLRSRACAAMITYVGEIHDRALRRLQLSAREGSCAALLLRPAALASHPSPAAVRIFAEPEPAAHPRRRRVRMTVLRCRGTTSSEASVFLEWSRDPLDERPTSWFADRAPAADDPGCERAAARSRSA